MKSTRLLLIFKKPYYLEFLDDFFGKFSGFFGTVTVNSTLLKIISIRKRSATTASKNQSYGSTTPEDVLDEFSMNATHECNISSFYRTANWFIKNRFFVKERCGSADKHCEHLQDRSPDSGPELTKQVNHSIVTPSLQSHLHSLRNFSAYRFGAHP